MDLFFDKLQKKLREDIPISMSSAIDQAVPIWKVLNMTQQEYNIKYNKPVLVEEKNIIKELESVSIKE